MDFVKDEGVDILFLTGTWMKTHGDESKCVDLTPPGYKLPSFPRVTRGGGLTAIYRDHFPHSVNTTFPFSTFELVELTSQFLNTSIFSASTDPHLQEKQALRFSLSQ